jgi:hypothetical protein
MAGTGPAMTECGAMRHAAAPSESLVLKNNAP